MIQRAPQIVRVGRRAHRRVAASSTDAQPLNPPTEPRAFHNGQGTGQGQGRRARQEAAQARRGQGKGGGRGRGRRGAGVPAEAEQAVQRDRRVQQPRRHDPQGAGGQVPRRPLLVEPDPRQVVQQELDLHGAAGRGGSAEPGGPRSAGREGGGPREQARRCAGREQAQGARAPRRAGGAHGRSAGGAAAQAARRDGGARRAAGGAAEQRGRGSERGREARDRGGGG